MGSLKNFYLIKHCEKLISNIHDDFNDDLDEFIEEDYAATNELDKAECVISLESCYFMQKDLSLVFAVTSIFTVNSHYCF